MELDDGTIWCDKDDCGLEIDPDDAHYVTELQVAGGRAPREEMGSYCPEHCPICIREDACSTG